MVKIYRRFSFFLILPGFLFFLTTCDKSTDPEEPEETVGNISGKVMSGTASLKRAYIFIGDTLRATVNSSGEYSISSLEEGNYNLLCSAINYRDTINQVQVIGGSTVTCNFDLTPDITTGWIKGEFQDIVLWEDSLLVDPEMDYWDAAMIYQATTGATMISKFLQYNVPKQRIYLEDSLISITDDWAMFSLKIQCGTYPITGTCEGYYDVTEVVKVVPSVLDSARYVNFFMTRKPAPKLIVKK
jgi:hypothetical protein